MSRTLIASLLLAVAAPAAAQPAPPTEGLPRRVALEAPSLPAGELARLLLTELRAEGVDEVGPPDDGGALARIRVDGEGPTYEVTVDDLATDKRLTRRVDLGSMDPSVSLRGLAIAVAELLRASWLELATLEPEAVPDRIPRPLVERTRASLIAQLADPVAPPAEEEPPPPAPSRVGFFDLGFALRGYPSSELLLLGAALGLSTRVLDWLAVRAELVGVGSSVGVALGAIDVWQLTASIGARAVGDLDRLRGWIGPRIAVGIGWAAGRPAGPDVVASQGGDALVIAEVETGFTVRIVEWLRLGAAFAAGWTLAGLDALVDGVAGTGLRDGTLAGRILVGADL